MSPFDLFLLFGAVVAAGVFATTCLLGLIVWLAGIRMLPPTEVCPPGPKP